MKRICVVSTHKADYGRLLPVMRAIRAHPELTLSVVVSTHAPFDALWWHIRHGRIIRALRHLWWLFNERESSYLARLLLKEGISVDGRIPLFHKGGTSEAMVRGASAALRSAARVFGRLNPDLIVLHGDRFEVLAIAMAAAALNIPIAHIEGGDVSGTIDESVRHAISKLAHIHFPITKASEARLVAMGEDPSRIHQCGMTVLDLLSTLDLSLDAGFYTRNSGAQGTMVDFTKPFAFVSYHPVTTRGGNNTADVEELLAALQDLSLPKVIFAPNTDAGARLISDLLWRFALRPEHQTLYYKTVAAEDFYRLLCAAEVAIGNSSSLLREAAYLGTPVVLVGDRQAGRERGENVMEVPARRAAITEAIGRQRMRGRYPKDTRFGDGGASQCIADTLSRTDLTAVPIQKRFYAR